METWDALRARRNVRQYTDESLDDADIDRILEAGRRAPSGGNWQPWDFVVVTDRDDLRRLSGVWQGARHVAGAAAAICIVAPVPTDDRQQRLVRYDLGQVTMALAIAATDLGIGSGHSSVGDQDLAREILGFPEDRFLGYMLALGRPADRPLRPLVRPDRRPFEEVVHRGRW